jgi:uncharacterized protein (DUF1778 family)
MSRRIFLEVAGNLPYNVRMPETIKTSRLELRLTDEEKELYQRAADQDSRPLSNWIRDRLLKAARQELGEESAPRKRKR